MQLLLLHSCGGFSLTSAQIAHRASHPSAVDVTQLSEFSWHIMMVWLRVAASLRNTSKDERNSLCAAASRLRRVISVIDGTAIAK